MVRLGLEPGTFSMTKSRRRRSETRAGSMNQCLLNEKNMLNSVANQSYIIICSHHPVGQMKTLSVYKTKTLFYIQKKRNQQLISISFIKFPWVGFLCKVSYKKELLQLESLTKPGYKNADLCCETILYYNMQSSSSRTNENFIGLQNQKLVLHLEKKNLQLIYISFIKLPRVELAIRGIVAIRKFDKIRVPIVVTLKKISAIQVYKILSLLMNKNKPLIALVSPNYLLLTDFTYWLFVQRWNRGGYLDGLQTKRSNENHRRRFSEQSCVEVEVKRI